MPGVSPASRFSGESVRVGRSEASSNGRPRGMVIAFGPPKCTEPGLQASWLIIHFGPRLRRKGAAALRLLRAEFRQM